ncbi:hypothetical protein PIB30_099432 [Stylosanthes scabra]|uniref:Uncharacterized protein n=1 Tax=Stylosanthes scabra TaxID=79078 RepID=A0ABU6XWJ3_9FABA|nr:hypothetical protein [Stylosanthes scabra]
MRLMVVLGCSKSGGAAFGIPLSVGIQGAKRFESLHLRILQNYSRAPENRFYLQQSRFSEPFSKKNGISRPFRVDSDDDPFLEKVF